MKKLKFSVGIVFTCEPNLGSEYEVGWRWSLIAGQLERFIFLTRCASYKNIQFPEKVDDCFGIVKVAPSGAYYKSIDIPLITMIIKGRVLMRTHYLLWQILVFIWILANRTKIKFVHHICFVAAWFPPLAAFAGKPFIWGPIGTGGALPIWARINLRSKLWNFVTQNLNSINPFIRLVVNRCRLVIPINTHVASLINANDCKRSVIFPAIAQEPQSKNKATYFPIESATILYSGRLMPFKLPELALRTGQILTNKFPTLTFLMVGEGLTKLCRNKQQLGKVAILETMSQHLFFELLEKSQILLFPTTEGSGFVALEALVRGVPIVCTTESGPATFIGGKAGISVDIEDTLEVTAEKLASACIEIMRDSANWTEYSDNAVMRSQQYTWENLKKLLEYEYAEISKQIP